MTARDRHGRELRTGDRVRAVHFGEAHELTVEDISTEHGLHRVHGTVRVTIPAGATERVEAAVVPARERTHPDHPAASRPKSRQ